MADGMDFDRAFKYVVGQEGVFSKDPDDRGNWTGGEKGVGLLKGTKYGISAKAYPELDIENLTLAQARDIYFKDYWTKAHCPLWVAPLAFVMFDAAVNQGVERAVRCLQRAAGVNDDGVVGPHTLGAVRRLDERTAVEYFQAERILEYVEAATWQKHKRGWMRRAVETAMGAI
jgi:lysozyme family protein